MVTIGDELGRMPKIELHVHFGGNVEPWLAVELARRHGLDPGAVLPIVDGAYPYPYRDFPDFLRALIAVNDVVRTADDVERTAAAIAQRQHAQGVVYTELIVTALSHVRGGVPAQDFWRALTSGLAACGPDTRFNIVVDAIRDAGPADLHETVRLLDDADAPVVAIGLTGIEDTWPIEDFAFIRDAADRRGIAVEVHAGEMGPPSSIVGSLDVLGADRIGHGVAAINDAAVLERLVRDQVHLEVCPTSNLQIGLFSSMADHPAAAFWRAGVNLSISSDDPPLMGTTLTDELRAVGDVAGFTRADHAALQRRAARAAFLPASEREALVARVDAWELSSSR